MRLGIAREAGMGWIRTVWDEVFGLFVDDGSYAVAILAWIVVAGLALPCLGLGGYGRG